MGSSNFAVVLVVSLLLAILMLALESITRQKATSAQSENSGSDEI